MVDSTNRGSLPVKACPAFTLIEVLVVVAIIALLLSILLPSLSKAREQARTVACAAKMQQVGRAGSTYQTESKGWIPGSPWSTGHGAMLSTIASSDWNAFAAAGNRNIVDWFDYATPLRSQMQGGKGLSRDRNTLLVQFTSDPFNCDANPYKSVPWPLGSPGPVIKSISYLSMLSIMRAGPEGYIRAGSLPAKAVDGSIAGHTAQASTWEMVVPRSYYPRIDRIGREAMKVFLADGFRFYDEEQNINDYDFGGFRGSKGIGNVEEPPSSAGKQYNQMYNIARRFAYRHGNKNRINALMFDGHAVGLTVDYLTAVGTGDFYKGYRGDAVNPKYYYPSGTVVAEANFLHLPIPVGTQLP